MKVVKVYKARRDQFTGITMDQTRDQRLNELLNKLNIRTGRPYLKKSERWMEGWDRGRNGGRKPKPTLLGQRKLYFDTETQQWATDEQNEAAASLQLQSQTPNEKAAASTSKSNESSLSL